MLRKTLGILIALSPVTFVIGLGIYINPIMTLFIGLATILVLDLFVLAYLLFEIGIRIYDGKSLR